MLSLLFLYGRCCKRIELPITAEIKAIRSFENQPFDYLIQPHFYFFRSLYFAVPAKRYDQLLFPHIL